MIAELLNRDIILQQLTDAREYLEFEVTRRRQTAQDISPDDLLLLEELKRAEASERRASSGQPGFDAPTAERRRVEPAPLDDFAFFSRDPVVSLLQSALDAYFDEEEHADEVVENPPADDRRADATDVIVAARHLRDVPAPVRTDDGRRLFNKFSITDARWVRSLMAEGVRLFRGRHEFNKRPAAPHAMHDKVRLVLVGDWGSGLPRAQKVAHQMRRVVEAGMRDGLEQHVIHLGDIYYSGWGREVRKRFLPYWPVRAEEAPTIGSWALNGNHEMYSGGFGYYDVLLGDDRFYRQQQSSFFSLLSPYWKILGLDTAWDAGGLRDPQRDWLADELEDRGRKVLLLSHHQLFSLYDSSSPTLEAKVAPLLDRTPTKAWFWGHEHRCMTFKPYQHVEYGVCVGHGGVPVYMWHDEGEAYSPPGEYEYRKQRWSGLEPWATFGFAVLDFDGPALHVRYIDEDGDEHYAQTIA